MKALTSLSLDDRRKILEQVLKTLDQRFYKPDKLGPTWDEAVKRHRPAIEASTSPERFEEAVTGLLEELKTSHVGFFHGSARRASSRAALSATYLSDTTDQGSRWIFQDVHEGGAAAIAGIERGDILLRVGGKDIKPPDHPTFAMGENIKVEVLERGDHVRVTTIQISRPKGKKLHFVEPKLVTARLVEKDVGYLKIAMFPGVVGVGVAAEISRAIEELGSVDRLIIDLRGNTGGGVGALRAMSLLTPEKLPVGFALDRRSAPVNIEEEKNRFRRFNRIPASKRALWPLAIRYLPTLWRKSPVVLETEGLGPRRFHGRVVLLVDRHTASAAEMIVAFAKENHLATIVGEKTAGRLLSATSQKVGQGYRLALPIGAYYTWKGNVLEGTPIDPEVTAEFDWREARRGTDTQFDQALEVVRSSSDYSILSG